MAKYKTAGTFLTLLKELQKVDNEFPLQYAICLTQIALNEGLSLTNLADLTGMPLSTVSRIVGALSHKRQKGTAYKLVKVMISSEEKRKKELYLTSRGQTVMHSITELLQTPPGSISVKTG